MYNRLGLLENFSALCLLLGFYLFVRAEERRWPAFALGVTAAVAALSKYLFAYFLVSTLAAVAWRAWRRSRFSELLLFLAGALAAALPWFLGIYLPFRSTFRKIGSGWGMLSLPRSGADALGNLLGNPLPRYLQLLPAVGLLLVLFLAWALLKLFRGRGREAANGLDVFVLLWIAGAFLAMGLLSYRPLRYYLPMVPALYLAVSLLLRDREWIRPRLRLFAPLAALSALPFLPFLRPLLAREASAGVQPLALRLAALLALAAALTLLFVTGRAARRVAASAAFAAMLGISLYLYAAHFLLRPSFRLEAASRYMENLPAGSVVLGQEAPRLTLGTRFQAVMAYENWFNDEDPFNRFDPDYVLALDRFRDAEMGWMRRRFPERTAALRLVRRFPVWDTTVSLYRVRR
jgi:4-amino-4-deoxy-L-arabinose transferase-like glycosyltransferase